MRLQAYVHPSSLFSHFLCPPVRPLYRETYQGRITIARHHVACIPLRWSKKHSQDEGN